MWQCGCGVINVNLNRRCVICWERDGINSPQPSNEGNYPTFDDFDVTVSDVNIYHRLIPYFFINYVDTDRARAGKQMTPKEELFSKFFNNNSIVVSTMDDLTLRAHREELERIAFEAKACLFSTDEEIKKRGSAKKKGGLNVSVRTDDVTSDAINTIKARDKKLSKSEKSIESLMKLGIDRSTAEAMLSASVVKDVKAGKKVDLDLAVEKREAVTLKVSNGKCHECGFDFGSELTGKVKCPECKTELELEKKRGIVNPFAARKEEKSDLGIISDYILHGKVPGDKVEEITVPSVPSVEAKALETPPEEKPTRPAFVNPFAKKE